MDESALTPNYRIHLTRRAVTALAEMHRKQDHHPGLPGPRQSTPAGDAYVSYLGRPRARPRMVLGSSPTSCLRLLALAASILLGLAGSAQAKCRYGSYQHPPLSPRIAATIASATGLQLFDLVVPSSYPDTLTPNFNGHRIASRLPDADSTGCAAFSRLVRAASTDTCCGMLDCLFMPNVGIRFLGVTDTIDIAASSDCIGWSITRRGKRLNSCDWVPQRQIPALKEMIDAIFARARQIEPGR